MTFAGKGIGFFVMIELIYYSILSFIPLAFPVGILLASVMVFGGMSEKYELASCKSAGIPLLRVMAPLILFGILISGLSVVSSNYVIPFANLKFKSRLYDIRKQKPALSIEEGTFNDDFQQFSIRIGQKDADNRTIREVMIEDNTLK